MKKITRRSCTGGGTKKSKAKESQHSSAIKNSIIFDIIQQFDTSVEEEEEYSDSEGDIACDFPSDNNDTDGGDEKDNDDDNEYVYGSKSENKHQRCDKNPKIAKDINTNDTIEELKINVDAIFSLLTDGETIKRVYTFKGPILNYKWTKFSKVGSSGKSSNVSKVNISKEVDESVELFLAILFRFTSDCEENRIVTGGMIFINHERLPGNLNPAHFFNSDHYIVRYILKRNLIVFDKCTTLASTPS